MASVNEPARQAVSSRPNPDVMAKQLGLMAVQANANPIAHLTVFSTFPGHQRVISATAGRIGKKGGDEWLLVPLADLIRPGPFLELIQFFRILRSLFTSAVMAGVVRLGGRDPLRRSH
jgi:hypothetical protein